MISIYPVVSSIFVLHISCLVYSHLSVLRFGCYCLITIKHTLYLLIIEVVYLQTRLLCCPHCCVYIALYSLPFSYLVYHIIKYLSFIISCELIYHIGLSLTIDCIVNIPFICPEIRVWLFDYLSYWIALYI